MNKIDAAPCKVSAHGASLQTDAPVGNSEQLIARCTPEAVDFCQTHRIVPLVEDAIRLAQLCFAPKHLTIYLSGDPDGEAEWLVVRSDISCTIDDALRSYGDLKAKWLALVPGQESLLVRFLYNIV